MDDSLIRQLIDRITREFAVHQPPLNNDATEVRVRSLHSHLGTIRQLVTDASWAVNASSEFVSLKHATDELERCREDLFYLYQNAVIDGRMNAGVGGMFDELDRTLRSATDPEYMS